MTTGVGINQRDAVRMTRDEQLAFLAERDKMALATHMSDGGIHLVTMNFTVIDGDITFLTKARSQKAVNLRRDPRATCLVEDGDSYQALRGVSVQGRVELTDHHDHLVAIALDLARKYGSTSPAQDEQIERVVHNRVGCRVRAERVMSWDHSKVGPPPFHQRS